jgi:hypothetical protein
MIYEGFTIVIITLVHLSMPKVIRNKDKDVLDNVSDVVHKQQNVKFHIVWFIGEPQIYELYCNTNQIKDKKCNTFFQCRLPARSLARTVKLHPNFTSFSITKK